jgi:hypothetical protein
VGTYPTVAAFRLGRQPPDQARTPMEVPVTFIRLPRRERFTLALVARCGKNQPDTNRAPLRNSFCVRVCFSVWQKRQQPLV